MREGEGKPRVGVVVIGRNEGKRLRLCMESVTRQATRSVYVDSGSSDGSVELAKGVGIAVVELDPARPFTAARARNEGAAALAERLGDIVLLQLVDGDCELEDGWLARAAQFLDSNRDAAAVCGRLRERHPEASIFNRLCDMEWDVPPGEAPACGGIAMYRAQAFQEVGGFDPKLIAGEEPDLCFRLRRAGWRIVRLDAPMATHDAAMFYARQWWQRAKRSGYADMEAYRRRGQAEPQLRRNILSNLLWSLPIAWPFWPILWLRVYRRKGALYACNMVLGKLPHLHGQIRYYLKNRRQDGAKLIEYK